TEIRRRAGGERDAPPDELGEEGRVLDDPDTVLDPVGGERVERPADGRGPGVLAGVWRGPEPASMRLGEQIPEGLRWEAFLRPAQPDPHHFGNAARRIEHRPRELEGEVPYRAGDEPDDDVGLPGGCLHRLGEAVVGPAGRRELELGIADPGARGVLTVLAHEARVVARRDHRRPRTGKALDEGREVMEG